MELNFAHYGEIRDVDATDGEKALFLKVCEIVKSAGYDNKLSLVRKSSDYVTAALHSDKYNMELDVARMKFTNRAKWIVLPLHGTAKHRISDADDLDDLRDEIIENFEFCLRDI